VGVGSFGAGAATTELILTGLTTGLADFTWAFLAVAIEFSFNFLIVVQTISFVKFKMQVLQDC
jgi:hypothetical protein